MLILNQLKQIEAIMTRYFNKDEVIAKLRGYIAENFKNQSGFAKHCGVTDSYVSGVITGVKAIPDEWLALIGYEQVSVYRKING